MGRRWQFVMIADEWDSIGSRKIRSEVLKEKKILLEDVVRLLDVEYLAQAFAALQPLPRLAVLIFVTDNGDNMCSIAIYVKMHPSACAALFVIDLLSFY